MRARLAEPIIIGDKQWIAVDFWVNGTSDPQVWGAFFAPRRKDGQWSVVEKRAQTDIPSEVIIVGAQAFINQHLASIDRMNGEIAAMRVLRLKALEHELEAKS